MRDLVDSYMIYELGEVTPYEERLIDRQQRRDRTLQSLKCRPQELGEGI